MAAMPDAIHPSFARIPRPGARALPQSQSHGAGGGFSTAPRSDRLLDDLTTHAIDPKYQYRHKWRPSDVVIWTSLHHAQANADYPDGEKRVMHRVVVAGTAPFDQPSPAGRGNSVVSWLTLRAECNARARMTD